MWIIVHRFEMELESQQTVQTAAAAEEAVETERGHNAGGRGHQAQAQRADEGSEFGAVDRHEQKYQPQQQPDDTLTGEQDGDECAI
jgi:hypothetical protein